MKKVLCSAVVGFVLAVNSFAGFITFDLLNDANIYSELDDQISASVTNGGVIATLTASDGVLNRTTGGFGVNGAGSDDTDALNVGQYIDVVFDQEVTFSSLNVSSWGESDAGVVQLGLPFGSQGSITNTGNTALNFLVNEGETVRILATADSGATNGFSVDSFTVSVPEPAVLGLIAFGSGIMMLGRRRKRRMH